MTFAPLVLAVALAATPLTSVPTAVAPTCDVSDATLDWGFKDTFRAYIDSDIANGEWTTSGGATYETPLFHWVGGTGHYNPSEGTGSISFTGSVRFIGHDGLLDTTIADPTVRFESGTGALLLDVSGPTMDGDPFSQKGVEFVELPSLRVEGDDAVRTVEAATTLTADGAVAFPNYPAGEAFDPIALTLTVGKACPTEQSTLTGDLIEPQPFGGVPVAVLIAAGAVTAAVAILLVFFLTRRRRRA